jgi:endonuclease/exonuclease/phosphatase family metal-dependent hydrolase
VKLLHWNIHMWRDSAGRDNRQAVRDLIADESPDVASLVEVDEPWGQPSVLAGLAEDLGYRWVFVPALEYRSEGGFGNALLVRDRIDAVQQWQLLPPRLYDGTEPSEPRAVVLGRVSNGQGACWVGSTHLPRNDSAMRAEASARLVRLLGSLHAPWIVCGDFNQPRDAWASPTSVVVVPDQPAATYPAEQPTEAIDYCMMHGITGVGRVRPSDASDHLPLVVWADASPVQA